jgi:hypothetical protein
MSLDDWPPQPSSKPALAPEVESRERAQLREVFFQQLVARKILERFGDELSEAGMSESQIQEIERAFSELSEDDKRATLAIPASLQRPLFEKYVRRIEKGEITPTGMVHELRDKHVATKSTIGYHLTSADIRPTKDDWKVVGKEIDHRHNDLPMAYYSLDYAHRYLKKPSQFLYVIKVDMSEGSGHYPDNNQKEWGHASTLAIIEKVDMLEIESELDEKMRAVSKEEKEERRDREDRAA